LRKYWKEYENFNYRDFGLLQVKAALTNKPWYDEVFKIV
jgi:hypothetical protein